jgi:23S rRNA (cytosine1962-C5)-methyltransferase
MSSRRVILKPGKDKPIRNRHHWIFSGAVASLPELTNGECLEVYNATNEKLGWGYFNKKTTIVGRMIAFDGLSPEKAIEQNLVQAIAMRRALFDPTKTNAYRLVNGEGDSLPGLVVDCYHNVLVIQISTLGMQQFRSLIVEQLVKHLAPRSIYEKSLLPSRKEEGLHDEQGALYGNVPSEAVTILENGLKFSVSILHGQKTGFFLDHRKMRAHVQSLAMGKKVLNCFAYTGGFSVYAAAGGAKLVDSVDISAAAMQMAQHNMELNGIDVKQHHFYTADVFEFLREKPLDYDLVILDPPAFAKRQKDVIAACRGYKDINRLAFEKMPKESILLTSSCSYHVNETLFQQVVFQAATEAKRNVKIIGRHQMAADHPINIYHPETDYLKTLVLYLD